MSSSHSKRASIISDEDQQELFFAALEKYFIRDTDGHVIDVAAKKAVSDHLLGLGFRSFNISDDSAVKISKDTIRDLIKRAKARLGVAVKIGTKLKKSVEQLKEEVKRIYDLKELRVIDNAIDHQNDSNGLAKIAADMLSDLVKRHETQNGCPVIAIGGGRSLYQMTLRLDPDKADVIILPTNYATRVTDKKNYDSRHLATRVHELLSNLESPIMGVPILPRSDPFAAAKWHSLLWDNNSDMKEYFEMGNRAEVVFLGTGNFAANSPSFSRVYHHLGVEYAKLAKMENPPVGDINLCFFDKNGNDLTNKIVMDRVAEAGWNVAGTRYANGSFIDSEDSHPFLIGYNISWLKKMVHFGKDVVVVAGNDGNKALPIHVLLKNKIVNCLVTDSLMLQDIVELNSKNDPELRMDVNSSY